MHLSLVTPPSVEPITAAECRTWLNLGADVPDELLNAFIKAARQEIDGSSGGWLGRSIIKQKWRATLGAFPGDEMIRLPLPPVLSIDSVKYLTPDGVLTTLDPSSYRLLPADSCPYLAPAVGSWWPGTANQADAVMVEYFAGYGEAGTDVPQPIRIAIALIVSNLRSLTERNLFVSAETVDGIGSTNFVVGGNAGAAIDGAVNSLLAGYRVFAL